jgi:uncharacterized protein YjeT (DUF2065 family)
VQFITLLAGVVVVLAGLYFVGFGVLAVVVPSATAGYLRGFAGSVRLHVLELVTRFVVGAAFVEYASEMLFGGTFHMFGWVLVITTVALAILPWRWHQRFAQTAVPAALRYLPIIGIAAVLAGGIVVWAVAAAVVR